MSKLLYANWHRLKHEKMMWIIIILMFLAEAFICTLSYINSGNPNKEAFDSIFFGYLTVVGIVVSGFVSMFIGTEYSDGTIRNKIVSGHSRTNIYLANFITCSLAGIAFSAAAMTGAVVAGVPMLGGFSIPLDGAVQCIIDALLVIPAFTAIFCMITMLVPNKARAVLICLVIAFVMFFVGTILFEMLMAPEYISEYRLAADGSPITTEVLNPHYLRGASRTIVQAVLDILPSGQCTQISSLFAPHLVLMGICSVIFSAVCNIIGCFAFRKKDLK